MSVRLLIKLTTNRCGYIYSFRCSEITPAISSDGGRNCSRIIRGT